MKIESARLHRVQIPFRGSFGHALSERSRSDAVFVELRDEQGGVGWGEILPREYVTGETIEGVLERTGPAVGARLVGASLPDRDAVVGWIEDTRPQIGRDLATFGGFEIALLDLAGRRHGFSLADVLRSGAEPGPALPAGVVIGFEVKTEDLKKHCIGLRWKGHTHVKVKVGRDDDPERLQVITKVFGPDVPLRLDANASWSPEATMEILLSFRRMEIPLHSIEQPIPADDIQGMRRIRDRSSVPVMADEAICSVDDAEQLIAAQAADIFNVRIGKHGGVLAGRAIVERARAAGIAVHLGTLVGESGVLTRVAEVFGRCVPGFACLDGKGQNRFLLQEDVLRPLSADDSNPAINTGLDAPGLGVDVDERAIGRLSVGDPIALATGG